MTIHKSRYEIVRDLEEAGNLVHAIPLIRRGSKWHYLLSCLWDMKRMEVRFVCSVMCLSDHSINILEHHRVPGAGPRGQGKPKSRPPGACAQVREQR